MSMTGTESKPGGIGADLLVAGRIMTGTREVGAVVAGGGKILFAGDAGEAEKRFSCPRRVEYSGGPVIPGLIDAHMHLSATGLGIISHDLRGSGSISEMAGRGAAMAAEHGFAVSSGWDQELFKERRYPSAADLDRAEAHRPMILYRFCTHVAVVNSRVLEMAGVDAGTPDPPGGMIGRDDAGNPDGLFYDNAVKLHIAPLEEKLVRPLIGSAVKAAADYAVTRGLTTLTAVNADIDEIRAVKALEREGLLRCRVRFFLSREAFESGAGRMERGEKGGMVRICGIKLFADGAFGARTALLSSSYSDMDTRGLRLTEEKEMEALIRKAAESGLQAAVHAIGDEGVMAALRSARAAGPGVTGFRLEHAALTPGPVREMLRAQRPVIVVQPHFLVSDWWLPARLGERCRDCYMFLSMLEDGLVLAGSSDAPVEPLDPWTGIIAAMDRGGHDGSPMAGLTGGEAVGLDDALKMYTSAAAAADGEEGVLGMLEPGAAADMVFLAGTPSTGMTTPPGVAATVVGGKLVYSVDDALSRAFS